VNDLHAALVTIGFGTIVLYVDLGTWIIRNSKSSKLFLMKSDGLFSAINVWIWRIVGAIACLVGLSSLLKYFMR